MSFLAIRNLYKSYPAGKTDMPVLENINLEIAEGEFVAIIGFSGSGKTTLISMIAGLTRPDRGEVLKQGRPVTGPGPDRGVVFQNYALMPWLTVHGNIALAVDAVHKRLNRTERRQRVDKYIELVGLSHAANRRPAELSGGMRQRVNVARALAASPDILLLDEPLSALDALTRARLQDEIIRIWEQDRKTVVLITNDVDEGLIMADRIIPLNPGPRATFGPEFIIDLPRPRDRTSINQNERFKRLRSGITRYLMQVGVNSNTGATGNVVHLPDIRPKSAAYPARPRSRPAAGGPADEVRIDPKYLEFFNVTKTYPTARGPLTVVDGFNLNVRKGEFISIIGHSGCGKSTVLSMAAGLSEISDGGIVLDGKEIRSAGPDRAVVFQAPGLFPWMTAWQNVAIGVENVYSQAATQQRDDIVEHYLARVGLAGAMHRKATELSNGMKQRVGIARAFALSPKLLLLDEPFGMLDSLTRWELQEVLMEVWARMQVTAIMVTHDVDEAILLADRVVMMTNGPHASIGRIMPVELPRPRSRNALLAHPDYYRLREELISFLAGNDHRTD